jgi:hypothetical protein
MLAGMGYNNIQEDASKRTDWTLEGESTTFIVEEIDLQALQLCKGDTEYETKSRSVDFRSEI